MSRPDEQSSAFSLVGAWLDSCTWPADRPTGFNALSQTGSKTFHETIQPRADWLQKLLQPPLTPQSSSTTAVMPTLGNVVRPGIRYFRALIWNLENFTHDHRPAGTKPVDSKRNRARSLIVADLAFRIGADALLIMETGSDVGEAMTHLAQFWADREKQIAPSENRNPPRSVEPLVSPATFGLPELPMKVDPHTYPAEVDKVRALMLAGEGYIVGPAAFPQITVNVLQQALNLLVATSNNFQVFQARPPINENELGPFLTDWAKWCLEGLSQAGLVDEWRRPTSEEVALLQSLLIEIVNFPQQFLSQPETELGRVREAIHVARSLADTYGSPTLDAGVLEIIQLTLLSWIAAKG